MQLTMRVFLKKVGKRGGIAELIRVSSDRKRKEYAKFMREHNIELCDGNNHIKHTTWSMLGAGEYKKKGLR